MLTGGGWQREFVLAAVLLAMGCGRSHAGAGRVGATGGSSAGEANVGRGGDGGQDELTDSGGLGTNEMVWGVGGTGNGGAGGVAEQCYGIRYSAEALPVDMYLMLDKSTSMGEALPSSSASKWDGVVSAIRRFVNSPALAGTGLGIQYFGQPDPCDVSAYATPAVPIDRLPDVSQAILASVDAETPSTDRPTAPALEGALEYMRNRAVSHPSRAPVVLLATDGLPNQCGVSCGSSADCLGDASCVDSVCDPDSITAIAELAKRYAEADPWVLTFVIGIGEGLMGLDALAEAGGTHAAYLIESGDVQEAFENAMLSVIGSPIPCEYDFPETDSTSEIDKDRVEVLFVSGVKGVEELVTRLPDERGCDFNDGQGWWYDDNENPSRILICPDTCQRFRGGRVSIRFGCEPHTPTF